MHTAYLISCCKHLGHVKFSLWRLLPVQRVRGTTQQYSIRQSQVEAVPSQQLLNRQSNGCDSWFRPALAGALSSWFLHLIPFLLYTTEITARCHILVANTHPLYSKCCACEWTTPPTYNACVYLPLMRVTVQWPKCLAKTRRRNPISASVRREKLQYVCV